MSSTTTQQLIDALDTATLRRAHGTLEAVKTQCSDLELVRHLPFVSTDRINLYHAFVWLFDDVFPGVDDHHRAVLGAAGILYFAHVVIQDRLIDGDDKASPQLLLACTALHERALARLTTLPLTSAELFSIIRRDACDYEKGVLRELQRRETPAIADAQAPATADWSAYEHLARHKAALLRSPVSILANLSGASEVVENELRQSVDQFSVANQILDDLLDWETDLRTGRTLFHETALGVSPERLRTLDAHVVGHELFLGTGAEQALAVARNATADSMRVAHHAGAIRWHAVCRHLDQRLLRVDARLRRQRQFQVDVRASVTSSAFRLKSMTRASEFLTGELQAGLPESTHRMRFPRTSGFTASPTEDQEGVVFQRAVIGWALRCAAGAGVCISTDVRAQNQLALLSARRADEPLGWAYFPNLRELSTDLDDWAQAVQAFDLADEPASALLCALLRNDVTVLERAIAEQVDIDGLPTWTADLGSDHEDAALQRRSAARRWGRGIDAEVNANVIEGLLALGYDPAHAVIRAALDALSSRQQTDGLWLSTWYEGPYYGTFVACRALA